MILKNGLVGILFVFSLALTVGAATISYSTTTPAPDSDDIYNLTGVTSDVENIGTASTGGGDDAATYIAQDRAAQGQSFITGNHTLGYYVTAVSLQHASYTSDTTWYTTTNAATLTVRIVEPQSVTSGATSSLSVLASESISVTGTETNTLGSTSGTGTGNWITVTFDSPVLLSANTTYGFDIASLTGYTCFFEVSGNLNSGTFTGGEAYTSGSSGTGGSSTLTGRYGDRVFIVHLIQNNTVVDNALIDDFESYTDDAALTESWASNTAAECSLSGSVFHDGAKAMQIDYSNGSTPYYSEITHTFSSARNFTLDGQNDLTLYFRGQAGNTVQQLYVVLEDEGWGTNWSVVNYSGDVSSLTEEQWVRWDIALSQFTQNNASLDLSHVKKVIIGVGSRISPVAGDSGMFYVDDIRLYPTRCIVEADFNGDCVVDINDLTLFAAQWLATEDIQDIIEDGKVDMGDFKVVSNQWQQDGTWPPADEEKKIYAVPFTNVTFADEFWGPRLQANRQVTIPYIINKLQETGRIDNFAIAGGLMTGTPQYKFPFDDTDIYKTLEGAAYSLMVTPDPNMDQYLDDLIVKIAAAQEDDGYLYTIRTNGVNIWCGDTRWSNLSMSHELYDAGHLFEAAIAHYQATGKTSLLNVAKNYANLLVDTFHDGGVEIPPGHEIVESALARLSDAANESNYLNLAKYYLDIRGTVTDDYSPWGTYHQDHLPVLQQTEAVGHVVRAIYLYMGMADVAVRTEDTTYRDALMTALDSIWHSVNDAKIYITGGLGSLSGGEAFGDPYVLPNNSYCETCAQIANVMWNQRMFLYHQDGKYIDALERTLYNALISGVSLKGDTFFYPNPLVSSGGYTRSAWFDCNCCIGNIARTIPSVPGYVYCRGDDEIYVNLYVAGTGTIPLDDTTVSLTQQGGYPWDGNMAITVNPEQSKTFTMYVRIPGWARNQPVPSNLYQYKTQNAELVTLDVNGTTVPLDIRKGYVAIHRTWNAGDQIHLSLPMPIRQVVSHPSIAADVNRVALERGPIVYCAEWPDFDAGRVTQLYIPSDTTFAVEYRNNMLGDSTLANKGNVLTGTVKGLYETTAGGTEERDVSFVAIPYYAWAHRGQGQMAVWLPTDSSLAVPVPIPTPEELLGYWMLDETSGTTAADASGNIMTGTLKRGLSFTSNSVTGKVGNALQFDGTDDYIDIVDGFEDFDKGCTVSVWVYPTAVKTWSRFIDFGNSSASDNVWFGRYNNTTTLAFECWAGSNSAGLVTAADAIELDIWQLFTATADSAGNAKLYKNGQVIGAGTTVPSSITRTRNYIGRSNWSADQYFQGNMDDVRIYNYCLDIAEVQSLYNP